jgi:hypothetical protein
LTGTIHSHAYATPGILDSCAKHKLTNVNQIHVSTMAIAKTLWEAIDADVSLEHQEPIVKLMSTNVIATHAEMVQPVLMA